MNSALPMNSMRFISGDTCGMKRFRMRPEKNAPKISFESDEIRQRSAHEHDGQNEDKLHYRVGISRRNQRVRRGTNIIIPAQKTANLAKNNVQKSSPPDALNELTMAATPTSDRNSDSIDAPTLSVEAVCRCKP